MRNAAAFLLLLLSGPLAAGDFQDILAVRRLEDDAARRIQARILDFILGPDHSSVFVRIDFGVRSQRESSRRFGEGRANKARAGRGADAGGLFRGFGFSSDAATTTARSCAQDLFRGFGFSSSGATLAARECSAVNSSSSTQTSPGSAVPDSLAVDSQEQEASQTKGIVEESRSVFMNIRTFDVVILHDVDIPPVTIKEIREAVADACGPWLRPEHISFRPIHRTAKGGSWWDSALRWWLAIPRF